MTQPDYAAIAREITNYGQARVESILRKHFEPVVQELDSVCLCDCPDDELRRELDQWNAAVAIANAALTESQGSQ